MAKQLDIVIPYSPRPQQREIHKSLRRFNVLVCHRRFGKTVTAVNQLIKSCMLDKKQRPRYAYIAPLYKQAKAVAWDYLKYYSTPIPKIQINQSELRIDYPHGGRIQLFGADNPDSLRGMYMDGIVIDEVAQCPANLYGEILRPLLADRQGFSIFIGTPKGHDHFYDLYHHALQNAENDWFCRMYRASETGIIAEAELEASKRDMALNQYLQEFECDFNISSAFILIPIEQIEKAFNRYDTKRLACTSIFESEQGQNTQRTAQTQRIIGLDVGMSLTGDSSAFVVREGNLIIDAGECHLDNTFSIAGWFREQYEKYHCHHGYIDSIGYGAGVAHTLQAYDMPITSVNTGTAAENSGQFANCKAELWWRARDFFAADTAILPTTDIMRKLGHELSTPSYDYTMAGKIKIESKKDLLKEGIASPNLADAFCLTFAKTGFFDDVIYSDEPPDFAGVII